MQLVKFQNVTVDYGQIRAVSDVSFDINQGDYVCIVGSNGSGKSSVIKVMLGLVNQTHGRIEINIDKSHISYVPQINMAERNFPATVFEIVITGTQKKQKKLPFYTKEDIKTANDAIKLMRIDAISKKRIGQLSRGQQQRVMLARAMCRNPKMLVLDEPCASLDPEITKELNDILEMLNKDRQVTIFMASHNMHEVTKHASRILVLDKSLKFNGSVKEYNDYKAGTL